LTIDGPAGSITAASAGDDRPPALRARQRRRCTNPEPHTVTPLHDFAQRHRRLFVLTGAGVSAGSGIPCYRDENGEWKRRAPMMLQEFLGSAAARQRYWARSMIGWPLVARAQPNAAHAALASLEAAQRLHLLVTQNVDGLHQRAGSARVIELHGNVGRVICLGCGAAQSRETLQRTLEEDNPEFADAGAAAAPDGDADLEPRGLDRFRVPRCGRCGGMLKPDVVFFGEGVPRDRVDAALAALEEADAMLMVGSSLMAYSGYRFCEHAQRTGKPVAAINRGRTRADHLFALKVEHPCAEVLTTFVERLAATPSESATVRRSGS
jgi:NAD-dependent SIR2 family protein deacetylase